MRHDRLVGMVSASPPRALAGVMVAGEGPERFEFGLDVLLAGLAAVSEKYA